MTDRIAVGTPVTVTQPYGSHKGADNLVVLKDSNTGYGVGPVGNDPDKYHDCDGWLYYNDDKVTPKQDTPQTKDSKVTDFNVGDKVEFTTTYRSHDNRSVAVGDTATVQDNGSGYAGDLVGVLMTSGKSEDDTLLAYPWRLKQVEDKQALTFGDIQVGDHIRRIFTFADGATDTREGVVSRHGSYYVETEAQFILAYNTDDKPEVILELLDRPEPVKEVWEDAKVGDVFKRVNNGGEVGYVTRREGDWLAVYCNGDNSSFSLTYTHIFKAQTVTKL